MIYDQTEGHQAMSDIIERQASAAQEIPNTAWLFYSIAISLKRIADALDKSRRNPSRELPGSVSDDQILSTSQLGRIMNYTPTHIRRLVEQGKIPQPIVIGGRKLGWRASIIKEFIATAQPDHKAKP